METKKMKLIHEEEDYLFEVILEKSLLEDVPETEIYATEILNKKMTSEIVLKLNKILPIPMYQHLKRVSNGRILLSDKELDSKEALEAVREELGGEVVGHCGVVKVAQRGPRTMAQLGKANTLWPCHFHRDKQLEVLLRGDPGRDQLWHRKWIAAAVQAGEASGGGRGAVIARGQDLVAVASDRRHESPTQHAVMVALDLVARTQGGGAWPLPAGSAAWQLGHQPPSLASPYLCTGCDAYLSHEPCVMCAMALVHSRVATVFFCQPDPLNGALVSRTRLQELKPLNHHYTVFKVKIDRHSSNNQ